MVALFDVTGKKVIQKKFPTNKNYDVFIGDLAKTVVELSTNGVSACACAIPGLVDRQNGTIKRLGNLPWQDKPIGNDISKLINNSPVVLENDAKIAGLAESSHLANKYNRVMYITISTGIGVSYMENGRLIEAVQDMEPGKMPLLYEGKIQQWENFASGRAMVERYGVQASDITDSKIWDEVAERISYGVGICCSMLQPEVIVFGGGAGKYSNRFDEHINNYLAKNLHPLTKPPEALLPAHYGNDSVVHGCYILLKQKGMIE